MMSHLCLLDELLLNVDTWSMVLWQTDNNKTACISKLEKVDTYKTNIIKGNIIHMKL